MERNTDVKSIGVSIFDMSYTEMYRGVGFSSYVIDGELCYGFFVYVFSFLR